MSNDTNRFAWERAVKDSDLPPMTRLVLFAMATEMDNDTRRASVTNETLAKAAGMSARSVYKYLKVAIETGWVTRIQRGHHVEGQRVALSVYVGEFPDRIGTPLRDGSEANRNTSSDSVQSQPERGGSQPERAREPTGKRVPTNHSAHSEHSSSGQKFDDIDIEVHRQIKAKKDRGEVIRNERALRKSIREDIIAQRELDRLMEEQEQGNRHVTLPELQTAAEALGRNLAGVEATEEGLYAAWHALGPDFTCTPSTWEVTRDAWRERTEQLRRTA